MRHLRRYTDLSLMGVRVGVAKFFLDQSIGIDETNTFQLKFLFYYSSTKTVGATVLGGLWELEWAWHFAETNLRCLRSSGICTPNLNSLAPIVSEISAFIRTDRQTDRRTCYMHCGRALKTTVTRRRIRFFN